MLNKLRHYLCGWQEMKVGADQLTEIFDLMYQNNIPFFRERLNPDGSVSVIIRKNGYKLLSRLADERKIELLVSPLHGLPVTLDFLRRRPMLVCGFILGIAWLLYSENLVWDIQIIGNTKTPAKEIIADLDDLGFRIGTYYPNINYNKLHADYVASQNDIAWLSVYMHGTVAEVQVKELYEDTRPKHEKGVYANIVATEDGIVESVNVFEGQAAVKAGDLVRKGQVLISGVVENKDGSVRYEYASGEVICRTVDSVSVKVGTEREIKRYTGREKAKKTVKIFKKSINLFIKGGIEYPTCDKIDMMEQVCPFGLINLPVWISTTVYKEYETAVESVPVTVAADDAMKQLSVQIKEKTEGAELTSRSVTAEFEDGVYKIDCVLYMLRDIGETAEFTVQNTK